MPRQRNVGTIERIVRIVGGGLAVLLGLLLVRAGFGSLVRDLGAAAAVSLGIDFIYTGARGYCPLYHRLGWSTAHRH